MKIQLTQLLIIIIIMANMVQARSDRYHLVNNYNNEISECNKSYYIIILNNLLCFHIFR